jgi:hypothetical protein
MISDGKPMRQRQSCLEESRTGEGIQIRHSFRPSLRLEGTLNNRKYGSASRKRIKPRNQNTPMVSLKRERSTMKKL